MEQVLQVQINLIFRVLLTHELGHGHQLAHVRNPANLMHFSIGKGQRKATLTQSDIEAGDYIMSNGTASSPCGPSTIIEVQGGACVLTSPEAQFTIDDTIVCPNETVLVEDITEGSVSTYSWSFGADASIATSSSKGPHTISYATSGIKTIQLIVTNIIGSDTVTKQVEVKVNSLDTPTFIIPTDSTCLGADIYSISSIDNAEDYKWTVSSGGTIVGSAIDTLVEVEWNNPGIQFISIEVSNECISGISDSDSIFVTPNTEATFTDAVEGLTVSFSSTSLNAESHLWAFGDGKTSIEESPEHAYPDKGDYTVKYKTSNLCSSDSISKDYTLNFSVSVNDLEKNFEIYPNPIVSGAILNIEGIKSASYEWLSLNGDVISCGSLSGNSLIVPSLSSAIYILKLTSENGIIYHKIQVIE